MHTFQHTGNYRTWITCNIIAQLPTEHSRLWSGPVVAVQSTHRQPALMSQHLYCSIIFIIKSSTVNGDAVYSCTYVTPQNLIFMNTWIAGYDDMELTINKSYRVKWHRDTQQHYRASSLLLHACIYIITSFDFSLYTR